MQFSHDAPVQLCRALQSPVIQSPVFVFLCVASLVLFFSLEHALEFPDRSLEMHFQSSSSCCFVMIRQCKRALPVKPPSLALKFLNLSSDFFLCNFLRCSTCFGNFTYNVQRCLHLQQLFHALHGVSFSCKVSLFRAPVVLSNILDIPQHV